jgi:hypothetical protein
MVASNLADRLARLRAETESLIPAELGPVWSAKMAVALVAVAQAATRWRSSGFALDDVLDTLDRILSQQEQAKGKPVQRQRKGKRRG